MNTKEQIKYLADRYSDCGMTVDKIRAIMADISGKDDRAKLIETVSGIKIGDETIGRAAMRYTRKYNRAMGV